MMSGAMGQMMKDGDGKKRSGLGLGKKLFDRFKKKKPTAGNANPDVPAPEYKRGGKVRKTGLAKLHKGERVLTKRQAKSYRGSKSR
jgi:hypothetical protein